MKIEYGSFISPADSIVIATLTVLPDGEPKGVVQLAHGMAEHKERYLPFMKYLASKGYLCGINDHRGHGKSIHAEPGYFGENGGSALVEDMHKLTSILKRGHEDLPFFLFGHSMGSLAVRAYTKRYDNELDGLVVCGCPSGNPAANAGLKLVRAIAKVKGGHAYSKFVENLAGGGFNKRFENEGSSSAWLSVNLENRKAFEADPLCGFTFTLNGYEALMWLMCETYSKKGWAMKNAGLPILFVSGADDPCGISPEKIKEAAEHMASVGYKLPTVKLWDGMRHEILNETDREQVYEYVCGTFDVWAEKK